MILCLSGSLNKPRNAFISQAENMGMQGCKRKGLRRIRTLHFCCVVLAVDAFGGARFSQGRAVCLRLQLLAPAGWGYTWRAPT